MLIWILFVALGAALGVGGVLLLLRRRRAGLGRLPSATLWRRIAVPLFNGCLPAAALAVAAHLSRSGRGEVVLLAIVLVPRTMSIGAEDVPGLEAALAGIEDAERVVQGLGAEARGEVVRVREAADIVPRICAEIGADVVVVEPDPATRGMDELVHALTEAKHPRGFDVVITRAAQASRGESAARPDGRGGARAGG